MGGCFSKGQDLLNQVDTRMLAKRPLNAIRAKRDHAFLKLKRAAPSFRYKDEVSEVIKSRVIMFSGCKDSQTSADVQDVSSFGLPAVSDAEKAGGACTNSLLVALKEKSDRSYGDLLIAMRKELKKRNFKQIPQLSSTASIHLSSHFSPWNPDAPSSGERRSKSLLIGINYTGQSSGVLNGCVNDAVMLRDYLISQGFSSKPEDMTILADDPCVSDEMPTAENILTAMAKLVKGAKKGDSLFLHYSGHGSQVSDKTGDEKDGKDETIVPVDFKENGQITDDTLFQLLVGRLPEGVSLVCVFDCCHSGTILDLPFIFSATDEGCDLLESGDDVETEENPSFSLEYAKKLISSALKGVFNQVLKGAVGGGSGSGGGITDTIKKTLLNMGKNFF